jgi:hypothetical protein
MSFEYDYGDNPTPKPAEGGASPVDLLKGLLLELERPNGVFIAFHTVQQKHDIATALRALLAVPRQEEGPKP